MGALKPWHIIVLVLLVLLLFGAGKLPSLARNVGKSMRIFKSEVEELRGDEKPAEDEDEYDRRRTERRTTVRDEDGRTERTVERREREYDPRDGVEREERYVERDRDADSSYRRD